MFSTPTFTNADTLSAQNLWETLTAPWNTMGVPDDFPLQQWEAHRTICRARWSYFTGEAWEEKEKAGKVEVDKYPLRINPIQTFAFKHAYTLFGEIPDNGNSLVMTRMVPETNSDADKAIAHEAEQALERVKYETNLRAVMMENGIMSQFLGGCVFKVSPAPFEPAMPSGVKVERIVPDYFWAEADGSDMYNLLQCWVVTPITAREARDIYNVQVDWLADDLKEVLMVEHWDRKSYQVSIEKKLASRRLPGGGWMPLEGPNTRGVVPFVYIPHERAGSFHGRSHVESLASTVKELNSRMADAGDAVREESRQETWVANVPGSIRTVEIAPGRMAYNLGQSAPGADSPAMGVLTKPKISGEMNNFIDKLFDQIRRDGNVPKVADGEDEGSQRSALTLAFRMWPLTSHIRSERIFWTPGLNLLDELILMTLVDVNSKRITGGPTAPASVLKIGKQHLGHMKQQKWHPMIPRDREQLVNEMILRASANHVPIENALAVYGDVDDIDEAIASILEWLKKINAIAPQKPGGNNPAAQSKQKLNVPVAAAVQE